MSNRTIVVKGVCELNSKTIRNTSQLETIKYLDTGNITRNIIDNIQHLSRSIAPFPSRAQRKVKHQTIIYSTVRPAQEHYGFLVKPENDLIVSTGFLTVDVRDKGIEPKFLYYTLTQKCITNYLQTIATNNVSSYPSINPDDLGNLKFTIPNDKKVQQRIAEVLTTLDSKIELNNRINAELEAMAKTLYDYWFVQFDFPDKNGKPYKSSGGKMVWNEELKREIPWGWEVKDLGDIMSLEYGKPLKDNVRSGKGYPVLGSNGIVGYHHAFLVKGPGVVVGRKGTAGAVLWVEDDFFPIDTTFYVSDKLGMNSLIYHYLLLLRSNIDKLKSGSAVPGLNRNLVYSIKIAVPKSSSIILFNKIVGTYFSNISNCIKQNQTLTTIRDFLLPMLMNGQVKVQI